MSLKFATIFHKKIIRQKGRKKIKGNVMKKKILAFFLNLTKKNLRGRKFRWGVFKGARGGGFGVGRFKRGADLEHNLDLFFNKLKIRLLSLLSATCVHQMHRQCVHEKIKFGNFIVIVAKLLLFAHWIILAKSVYVCLMFMCNLYEWQEWRNRNQRRGVGGSRTARFWQINFNPGGELCPPH